LLGEHHPAEEQAAVVFADSHIHGDWELFLPSSSWLLL